MFCEIVSVAMCCFGWWTAGQILMEFLLSNCFITVEELDHGIWSFLGEMCKILSVKKKNTNKKLERIWLYFVYCYHKRRLSKIATL